MKKTSSTQIELVFVSNHHMIWTICVGFKGYHKESIKCRSTCDFINHQCGREYYSTCVRIPFMLGTKTPIGLVIILLNQTPEYYGDNAFSK